MQDFSCKTWSAIIVTARGYHKGLVDIVQFQLTKCSGVAEKIFYNRLRQSGIARRDARSYFKSIAYLSKLPNC